MSRIFNAPDWLKRSNIYEVNIRQYTPEGNFQAFSKHLARLRDMGVSILWFMPITPIAQEKKKGNLGSYYACSDYTSINPEFGTLDDFKNLVSSAQKMGFKVIIDWVANHTGWGHVWTKTNPEYFERNKDGSFCTAPGMDDIIELNYNNAGLQQSMIEALCFWVRECNIDGFRCDLASWVPLSFWLQARKELDKLKPLCWLGEFDILEASDYLQVFDIAYTWVWMRKTEAYYKSDRNLRILTDVLGGYGSNLPEDTTGLYFTTNHDENSWNGTEFEKYGLMAQALAVFSFTWPGIPLVYSGQEIPTTQRIKFFDKDLFPFQQNLALEEFYKKLLSLRTHHPALHSPDPKSKVRRVEIETDRYLLVYERSNEAQFIWVLLNFSDYPSRFTLTSVTPGRYNELFSGEQRALTETEPFALEPWGYQVWVGE